MMKKSMMVTSALLLCVAMTQIADAKKKKDLVVGTIWSFQISHGDRVESGEFRMVNQEIFRGAQKIGIGAREDKNDAKLVFKGFRPLNGTATMHKVHSHPAIWRGELVKDDGTKWKMSATVKEK